MSKNIGLSIEALSNEKDIPIEMVFESLETALESATKKLYNEADVAIKVEVNRKTGDYKTFRLWEVVADMSKYLADAGVDAEGEAAEQAAIAKTEEVEEHVLAGQPISLEDAASLEKDAKVGDVIKKPIESVEFGRIAAQAAKQVMMQKLRAAKRKQVADDYKSRIGDVVTGSVKKVNRDFIVVELSNNADGIIHRADMLPGENVRYNDKIRSYVKNVNEENRGPQIELSRADNQMLIALFNIEVPEIGEGQLEIKGAARDPGSRAKIAVLAKDTRIDPIGACVGMRGSRVQAVSSELNGERIDIVLWDEEPAQYVINALAPAEVSSIVLDDEKGSMDIIVDEDNLSQVIGRNGENVRLASQLTGWELNVLSERVAKERTESEAQKIVEDFVVKLELEQGLAEVLVSEGLASIEELAYIPAAELLQIEGMDEELIEELKAKANDYLLVQAISGDKEVDENDLLAVEGVNEELKEKLQAIGINDREELAELATDELLAIENMTEAEAGSIIMKAREIWFKE